MKKRVTRKIKSGGLHERHVVATWKLGNHLGIRFRHRETKKNLCRGGRSQGLRPVAGPNEVLIFYLTNHKSEAEIFATEGEAIWESRPALYSVSLKRKGVNI